MSLLIVDVGKRRLRQKRPNEETFAKFLTHGTVDSKFYEEYMNVNIAEDFLQKNTYVRFLMGSEKSINLLN